MFIALDSGFSVREQGTDIYLLFCRAALRLPRGRPMGYDFPRGGPQLDSSIGTLIFRVGFGAE